MIFGELEPVVVVVLAPKAEVDIPSQLGMAMLRKQKVLLFRRVGMTPRIALGTGANPTVLNKLRSLLRSRMTNIMEFRPRLLVNFRKRSIRLELPLHGATR